MAKAPQQQTLASSGKGMVVAGLLVTLIAAGGGLGLGTLMPTLLAPPEPGAEPPAEVELNAEPGKPDDQLPEGVDLVVKPLTPIIANLASPRGTWIRMEISLIIEKETEKEADALAALSAESVLALLRTVNLSQIEGPSGFLHLREDIDDLLAVSSDGKIRDTAILSMVVE